MNAVARRSELKGARVGLLSIVVVAIVVVVAAWFLHNFHRVEREFPLPARGEAAYNPLYALRKSLEADGVKVDARQRLDLSAHLPQAHDTLLLFSDPRTMSPPDVRRVFDWVEQGGHLILRTPQGYDWNGKWSSSLFDELGVVLRDGEDDERNCMPLQVEGEASHVEFCNGRRFDFDDTVPELSWGDLQHGYVYARLGYGDGRVDVLADMDFLTNGESPVPGVAMSDETGGGLRDVPHRALTRQLLAPNYGQGIVHLVYAVQMPSLWRWLLAHAWVVWVPLALALLAWLWRRARRFGPQRPTPSPERRSLLEHVRASGEHVYRYGRGVLLYAAVRQAFLARLRRRDPLVAALSGEPQIAALAERFRLPAEPLRKALQTPASHDRAAFRERISLLIELRNRL